MVWGVHCSVEGVVGVDGYSFWCEPDQGGAGFRVLSVVDGWPPPLHGRCFRGPSGGRVVAPFNGCVFSCNNVFFSTFFERGSSGAR